MQFDGTLQDYLYQDLKSAGCRMVSVQCRYGHGCVVFTQTQDTMTIWEAAMDPACFYATLSTLAGRFGAKRVLLTGHPVYAPRPGGFGPLRDVPSLGGKSWPSRGKSIPIPI